MSSQPEEITVEKIFVALKGFVESVDDHGKVLLDENFATKDEEFYDAFVTRTDNKKPHGVLITYLGFTQKQDGVFYVIVKHRISIEVLYPYDSLITEDKNSHKRFRILVTGIRSALNAKVAVDLGLGKPVIRSLLQAEVDFYVKPWAGENAKKLTHYGPMEILVEVREKIC